MKKTFILVCFLLCGCASMFSGTKETIVVQSADKDAQLYLDNEYIGTGAGMATISKRRLGDDLTIRASKKGCIDATKKVETKIDGVAFLGCLIDWCVVTVGVIDWLSTGAIREAAQTNYLVTPICEN